MEEFTFSVLQAGFMGGWLKIFLMGFVLTALAPAPGLAAQLLRHTLTAERQALDQPKPVSGLDVVVGSDRVEAAGAPR